MNDVFNFRGAKLLVIHENTKHFDKKVNKKREDVLP